MCRERAPADWPVPAEARTTGNWGIGVWQDDVADDVVMMFDNLLDAGATALEE
jgi:hypothetical protein